MNHFRKLVSAALAFALTAAMLVGLGAGTSSASVNSLAPPAPSSVPAVATYSAPSASVVIPTLSWRCSSGRCAVYLSKSETKALGRGKVPAVKLSYRLGPGFFIAARAHIWIAKQYGKRNWCSAFLLSTRPCENQGYKGYR